MLLLMIEKLEVPLMLIARTVIALRNLNERLHHRAPARTFSRFALNAQGR